MNLREPLDPTLAEQVRRVWPIALREPRIPVVRVEIEAPAFRMRSGPWSDQETLDLLRLYSSRSMSPVDLRAHFKRTITEIYRKAASLGLKRPKRG